ncbi:glycosyltransferase family 29 protein [Fulvimarina sp. 2208YS6-2-32]|uniref:Glycosyltransferase family 29 protein n=1 Tax=Fulvimarina uroteuthidis TaxID=3098149 RepID=A0ABU5HYE1_9HYPH|nr:glycosyltransferase family 29 protein [Fulvimarina sp. 2208YS6-2-32]MDY8108151.1 glycosyltransferase family 29 protein [Fulvimarina sp. 2208YS6-2-32]
MTSRTAHTKTVWIVGNAPATVDRSAEIDGADIVVRFNNAAGFGGVNGSRTTHLFLINCGGQMREWLDDPDFSERPQVQAADCILLPIHPDKDELIDPPLTREERLDPDARNYAREAHAMLGERSDASVSILPARHFIEACRTIGQIRQERRMPAPSTGLIALHWALATCRSPIDVTGFRFDGWPGHRWEAERAFFRAMEAGGRIRIHDNE